MKRYTIKNQSLKRNKKTYPSLPISWPGTDWPLVIRGSGEPVDRRRLSIISQGHPAHWSRLDTESEDPSLAFILSTAPVKGKEQKPALQAEVGLCVLHPIG